MTESAALPLLLPPPVNGAAWAGAPGALRAPDAAPSLPRLPGAGDGNAAGIDPFAAVLQGFLGAALPVTPPVTAAAPTADGAATGLLAAAPGTGNAQTLTTSGGNGTATDSPAGGKFLPLPDVALPLPAPTGASATATATPAGATPGVDGSGPDDLTTVLANVGSDASDSSLTNTGRGPTPDARLAAAQDAAAATGARPVANSESPAANLLADLARARSMLEPARRPAGNALELPPGTAAGDGLAMAAGPAAGAVSAFAVPEAAATLASSAARQGTTPVDTAAALASGTPVTWSDHSRLGTSQGGGVLTPLGDPASFASGLGERLLELGQNGTQSARLRLNPESLGPLDVQIRIEDGEAQVWFQAAHGQTRDAIEASLPRLRELFASQGVELGRVEVDVQRDGGAGTAGFAGPGGDAFRRRPDDAPADEPVTRRSQRGGSPPGLAAAVTGDIRRRLVDVLA